MSAWNAMTWCRQRFHRQQIHKSARKTWPEYCHTLQNKYVPLITHHRIRAYVWGTDLVCSLAGNRSCTSIIPKAHGHFIDINEGVILQRCLSVIRSIWCQNASTSPSTAPRYHVSQLSLSLPSSEPASRPSTSTSTSTTTGTSSTTYYLLPLLPPASTVCSSP
jgi:hypothetical protein